MTIIKTNNLPTTLISKVPSKYQGNFSKTVGLIIHKTAVGTVKLMDLAVESEYDIRRQGHLTVAKMALGSGVLRPESCLELRVSEEDEKDSLDDDLDELLESLGDPKDEKEDDKKLKKASQSPKKHLKLNEMDDDSGGREEEEDVPLKLERKKKPVKETNAQKGD